MPLKPQTRSEARPSLRRRLANLRAEAARIVLREPAEAEAFPVDACPDGFVPYPFGAPASFMAITSMIPFEAERLLSIAQDDFERRTADLGDIDEARAADIRAAIRWDLRIDDLARLTEHRAGRWAGAAADPVLVAIEAHRAAYAEWDRRARDYNELPVGSAQFDAASAAAREPAKREIAAFDALLITRPTTANGLRCLIEYLPTAVRHTSIEVEDSEAQRALDAIRNGFAAVDLGPPPADRDADLLALEAEFWAVDAARCAASDRRDDAENACAETPMPEALRVGPNDWHLSGFPQTGAYTDPTGQLRARPYSKEHVEHLRANPCMGRYRGGTRGELQPDGFTRLRPDVKAQERADAIVTAWDAWQAEIADAREAVGLPEAQAAYRESLERYEAILVSIRRAQATSLMGLAAKARVAADLTGCTSIGKLREEAERNGPADYEGLICSLAADVLDLTGGPTRG